MSQNKLDPFSSETTDVNKLESSKLLKNGDLWDNFRNVAEAAFIQIYEQFFDSLNAYCNPWGNFSALRPFSTFRLAWWLSHAFTGTTPEVIANETIWSGSFQEKTLEQLLRSRAYIQKFE